jgi:hypothetical protein
MARLRFIHGKPYDDPELEAQFQYDLRVANDVATKAEDEACRIMALTIEKDCENPEQRMLATALLTAAIITKFELSKVAMPNEDWGRAVDDIVRP